MHAAQTSNNLNKPERIWLARLALGYEKRNRRTVLAQREHYGPLYVQKPFYPEGDEVCHTYLLHPPAGIAGGDELNLEVTLAEECHALMTTPAATKFYRANPYHGVLTQNISMNTRSSLEWLPQENIIFAGAEAEIHTRIDLKTDCRLIAWDSQCLGRPACAEAFLTGSLKQRFEIFLEQEALYIDAMHIDSRSKIQDSIWGLGGCPVNSLMIVYPATADLFEQINSEIVGLEHVQSAATLIEDLLVIRCLGLEMEKVQNEMRRYWHILRPHIMNRKACPPRIWNT